VLYDSEDMEDDAGSWLAEDREQRDDDDDDDDSDVVERDEVDQQRSTSTGASATGFTEDRQALSPGRKLDSTFRAAAIASATFAYVG